MSGSEAQKAAKFALCYTVTARRAKILRREVAELERRRCTYVIPPPRASGWTSRKGDAGWWWTRLVA